MALIDDVKAVCDRLAPLGLRNVLLSVTGGQLDIQKPSAAALKAELTKNLAAIDRTVAGFTDFSLSGANAIKAGSPANSLLYHALASPNVKGGLTAFPTLKEIETVENFVFGVQPPTLAALRTKAGLTAAQKFSVVLFAYEYRPARDTCTKRQADLVFSRTGVSRVGTRPAVYNAPTRGFQAQADDDPFAFRVCPSRFAAFLAVKKKGNAATIMRPRPNDNTLDFWIPVHKLFNGAECIAGLNLQVNFSTFHFNDKIRRTRAITLGLPNVPATPPFQFTAGIAELSTDPNLGAGVIMPVPHPKLVERATVNGQFVTFNVPPGPRGFAALEPGAAQGVGGSEVRPALPAYVHARTQVRNGVLIDLNNDPTRPDVNATVSQGNYQALHYVDFTGEGHVDAAVPALAGIAEVTAATVPAYSLVGAPDFFPSAGQRELFEMVPADFWGVPPVPLCDTRLPANLQMPNNRFDAGEKTVSAVVALFGPAPAGTVLPQSFDADRHSCITDDCAGVFAPGWDVSTDRKRVNNVQVQHLAAYGLGSPFPEDSKLCAALSTFWPAVAPDASRSMSPNTGNPGLRATVAPMTDAEIGQVGSLPWDGVVGPKISTFGGAQFLDFEKFIHVDYVTNALEGRFSPRLTTQVSSEEYRARMQAMARIYDVLGGDRNLRTVVSFRKVSTGDPELQRAQIDTSTVLTGPIYRIDMITGGSATEQPHPTDFRRSLLPIQDRQLFFNAPQTGITLRKRANQTVWSLV